MKGNTSCWNCSSVYPETWGNCPNCGSTNANVDFYAAMSESNLALILDVNASESKDDPRE
jgi:RNA polymerase subunit RPABC4/transcription elongation factor Spt4